MLDIKLDALIVTTEAEIRYHTGFHTQFFESPTRPWFVVIPAEGKPIAVIPTIGESGMQATWIDEVHTWPAPRPADDGVSLLQSTVKGSAQTLRAGGYADGSGEHSENARCGCKNPRTGSGL